MRVHGSQAYRKMDVTIETGPEIVWRTAVCLFIITFLSIGSVKLLRVVLLSLHSCLSPVIRTNK